MFPHLDTCHLLICYLVKSTLGPPVSPEAKAFQIYNQPGAFSSTELWTSLIPIVRVNPKDQRHKEGGREWKRQGRVKLFQQGERFIHSNVKNNHKYIELKWWYDGLFIFIHYSNLCKYTYKYMYVCASVESYFVSVNILTEFKSDINVPYLIFIFRYLKQWKFKLPNLKNWNWNSCLKIK